MRTRIRNPRILLVAAAIAAVFHTQANAQTFTYCGPTDVVFLVDDTSTMGPTLFDLNSSGQANLINILDAIDHSADPQTGATASYRLALVTFKDNVTVRVNFSIGNRAEFLSAFSTLTASGGGTGHGNASDEALRTAINSLPASARLPGQQTGDFTGVWRSAINGNVQVRKLIILLTDSLPGGFFGDYTTAVAADAHQRAVDAAAAGIKILAIWPNSNATYGSGAIPIMQDYATVTGGYFSRTDEPSPPFLFNPPVSKLPSSLISWYLTHPDDPLNGIVAGCNPVNRPPFASCGGAFELAGPTCGPVPASIENVDALGDPLSFDWEDAIAGIPLAKVQTPAGPFYPGVTPATLSVTDSLGATDICSATVTVIHDFCLPPPPTITSLTATPASEGAYGSPVTWTATGIGGIMPLQYEFWRYCYANPGWSQVQPYSTNNTYTWTPGASDVGLCYIHARVRSDGSTATYEGYADSGAFMVTSPTPLKVVSVVASPVSPAQAGTPITWTATTSGGTGPIEFEFWRYSYATGNWGVVQAYSNSPTFSWTPGANEVGVYAFHVRARSAGSTSPFEAYYDTLSYAITSATPVSITSVTASPASPVAYGTPVTWNVVATGGGPAGREYEFWSYCSAAPGWIQVQPYSALASYTWTPTQFDVGMCYIHVRARTVGSPAVYEATFDTGGFMITEGVALTITGVDATPAVPVRFGTAVTWTATATGGTAPLEFQFWRYSRATGLWTMVQDYSTAASYTWSAAASEVGIYALHVRARSSGSFAAFENYFDTRQFAITTGFPATVTSITPTPASSATAGTVVTLDAVGAGGTGSIEYQFWDKNLTSGTWTLIADYSTSASATWTATGVGTHQFQVNVRSVGSTLPFEGYLLSANFIVN